MNPGWLLAPLGGGLLLALLLAVQVRAKRRCFERRMLSHACPLCRRPFAESLYEYLGRPAPAHLARLDNFQRRFAHFAARCLECGALVICAEDGTPVKAIVE